MDPRLVLGLAGTVDYEIVWDESIVEGLVAEYGIRKSELRTDLPVRSERDLVVALLAFVRDGDGSERFVSSSAIVETFAARFQRRVTLGGTNVRAALAMHELGIPATLHLVSIDDHVRRLLPRECSYLCSAKEDTTDPHLIVQFSAGARIRAGDIDLVAPHPNRVIFANDPPHRELVLSDNLGAVLASAELFLISSFNVMQDPVLLDERLFELQQHMRQLPLEAFVYYEDAGFHVPSLSRQVRDTMVGLVDVYSMNENEMQDHLGRPVDLLNADEMRKAIEELQILIPAPVVVVHSKYWALAAGQGCQAYEESLRASINLAGARYYHGDHFGEDDYRLVGTSPVHPLGAAFARELEDTMGPLVRCLPSLDLKVERPTLIGLGDTFVGGFIAGLVRDRATGRPLRPAGPRPRGASLIVQAGVSARRPVVDPAEPAVGSGDTRDTVET